MVNPATGEAFKEQDQQKRLYAAAKQKAYRNRLKAKREESALAVGAASKAKAKWNAKYNAEEKVTVRYSPQAHQAAFRAALDAEDSRVVLMLGGIRSGKTYAGAFELVRRIYTKCPKKGLSWIISPTFPMSLIVERAFEEAAEGLILKKLKGEKAYLLYPHKESKEPYRVEIKTAEVPDRLRGASVDVIWIDEASMDNIEVWKICLGRVLDSKGLIYMTTTPRGKNWLYHEVYIPSQTDPRIKVIKASTLSNKYLDKEDVERLKSKYSTAFAAQEIEAEFVSFEGLVYNEFNSDRHVIPPMVVLPDSAEVIVGIDAGLKDPFVYLWSMKFEGRWYIVDEYYCPERTIESHSIFIKRCRFEKDVRRRWADPSAAQERTDLDAHGLRSYPAKNDVRAGINSVKRAFETDRIRITSNCVNTIRELGQYHYKDGISRNSGEEPVDVANHAMDALRYIIYSEEGFGASHPYILTDDTGQLKVMGQGAGNALSNRLEDWINAASNPMGQVSDEEWLGEL